MAIVTNFDQLKQAHEAAVIGGSNSRAWIEFASTMMDSFPKLYLVAKGMNNQLKEVQDRLDAIRKEVA